MKALRRWWVPRRWLDRAVAEHAETLDALQAAHTERAAAERRLAVAEDEAAGWKSRALRDDNLRAASPLALRSRCAHLEDQNATLLAKLDEATAELARRPDAAAMADEARHG